MNFSVRIASRVISAIILALLTCSAYAKVQLPAIITNDMVLQQKSKVLLWGTAARLANVIITTGWNQKQYKIEADTAGHWRVKVTTPAAGGPYRISFNDGDLVELEGVLIGEVWVCSGQSNMEMPVKGYRKQPVLNEAQMIAEANLQPPIRIFRVPKVVSAVPLSDCKGKWFRTDSQTVKDFSAIAYQYAAILQKKLNVPVGIIATYWGGTAVQSWMSERTLRQVAGLTIPARWDTIKDPEKNPEESPAILFNSMIAPIAGYGVKGFLWYQGESNRYNPGLYYQLLPKMVKEWRTLWGNDKLPFYYVQIAPYGYKGPNDYFSALLREVQYHLEGEIPNSGMVVTMDVGKQKFIHPPDKTTISRRLANYALAKTYHAGDSAYQSPDFKSMDLKRGAAYLNFSHAGKGLILKADETGNFEIAGNDRVFYPAQATVVDKNTISVSSNKVPSPVAVRYAFKNWTSGNLFNSAGLPASSFRTDKWIEFSYAP